MAHAATLQRLWGLLVASIVGDSPKGSVRDTVRDSTFKTIRSNAFPSTNPFGVEAGLSGLVEKFIIRNREDLSLALQQRLDELSKTTEQASEILLLLMLLSDHPVEKTTLADPIAPQTWSGEKPPLWEDIFSHDAFEEDGIWDDIQPGYHSSGDDTSEMDDLDSDQITQATTVDAEDTATSTRTYLLPLNPGRLRDIDIVRSQASHDRATKAISELVLIRETVAMLEGRPSHIYEVHGAEVIVHTCSGHRSNAALDPMVQSMLDQFATIGTALNALRRWAAIDHIAPVMQSSQEVLRSQLSDLDLRLYAMEQALLIPERHRAVSLIHLQTQVEACVAPFIALENMTKQYIDPAQSKPSTFLDQLYNLACVARMSGDDALFTTAVAILMPSLATYLRPLMHWMQSGDTDARDIDFLVEKIDPNCALGRLWCERFKVRTASRDGPFVPVFLIPFVECIFVTGKSRAFLTALKHDWDITRDDGSEQAACRVVASLSNFADELPPFSETLSNRIQEWIHHASRDCTPALLRNLFLEQHLLEHVRALQYVFHSRDAAIFETFAEALFWRIDHNKQEGQYWPDRFLLTELSQRTLGSLASVDAENLSVTILNNGDRTGTALSATEQLKRLQLDYYFPWPVQNITGSTTAPSHSQTLVLLLQCYRAKYVLRQQTPFRRCEVHPRSDLAAAFKIALKIRQVILVTVDVLLSYITDCACTLGIAVMTDMTDARDIDSLRKAWAQYDEALRLSLLLAERMAPLREAIISFLEACESFSSAWEWLLDVCRWHGGSQRGKSGKVPSTWGSGRLLELSDHIHKTLSFIAVGVCGISRAGGQPALEVLGERFDWILQRK